MGIGRQSAVELYSSLTGLLRTTRALGQRNRDAGATGTSLGVLKVLEHGDLRPGDLATALHVVPSVISRAIAPLEQEGLVERKVDPEDRRASLLGLTTRGSRRLSEVQQVLVGQLSQTLESWTDEEVEQASLVLNRLEAALASYQQPETHRHQLRNALAARGSTQQPDESAAVAAAQVPPVTSTTTTAEKVSA